MPRLTCGCCGSAITRPEDNVAKPGTHDRGYGKCRRCGGDDRIGAGKDYEELTETELRGRLGYETMMFVEVRFPLVRKSLSPVNQPKWDGEPLWKKAAFVLQLVEKGKMI